MIEDEMRELRERIEGLEMCLRATQRMVERLWTTGGGGTLEGYREEYSRQREAAWTDQPGWWSREPRR